MDKQYRYTVHITKKKDGFLVEVPALPGCLTWGKTYDAAAQHAEEAIQAYLGMLVKIGEPIPVEKPKPTTLHLNIHLPVAV